MELRNKLPGLAPNKVYMKRYELTRWRFTEELLNDREAFQNQIRYIMQGLYLRMKNQVGECIYKTRIYNEAGGIVFYIEQD